MARVTRLYRAFDNYREAIGTDWEGLGRKLGMTGSGLKNIAQRGYCTPRIADRIDKASRGRLPAWLMLGLKGPPREDPSSGVDTRPTT